MFSLACKSLSFRQIDPKARVPLAQAFNRYMDGDLLGCANRLRIAYYRIALAACRSRGCKPKGLPDYPRMVVALRRGQFIDAEQCDAMIDYWTTIHRATYLGKASDFGMKLSIEAGYEMLSWFPELRPAAASSVAKGVRS